MFSPSGWASWSAPSLSSLVTVMMRASVLVYALALLPLLLLDSFSILIHFLPIQRLVFSLKSLNLSLWQRSLLIRRQTLPFFFISLDMTCILWRNLLFLFRRTCISYFSWLFGAASMLFLLSWAVVWLPRSASTSAFRGAARAAARSTPFVLFLSFGFYFFERQNYFFEFLHFWISWKGRVVTLLVNLELVVRVFVSFAQRNYSFEVLLKVFHDLCLLLSLFLFSKE